MGEVQADGARLYVDTAGDGVPFIALHGGPGLNHLYMRTALGPLEDVMRVTYLDMRSHGESERVDNATITMRQLADDVDAVREALGLERVGVIGHSYGGFVALEYATNYADRLSHLVCLDTSPGAFEPTPEELSERGDQSWFTPEVHAALDAAAQGFASDEAGFRGRMPSIAPLYVRRIDPAVVVEQFGLGTINTNVMPRGMQILADWSVAGELRKITCPTLVVCGRHDLQTTPECSKRLATAIPNAELVWFEDSAHFPWLEEREAFDAAMRDWLLRYP